MKKIEQEEENTRLARFISSDDREKRALQKVMDETKNGVSNKIQIAIDITTDLVSQGKKVVIWSQFTNPINVLEKNLKHLGVLTLYGGTKDTKDVIDQFNDPDSDIKILISNPQKGGEGISLHKVCHNAIYLDRDYDAAKYLQSRDRIHRIGLKNPKQYTVNYFFLESTYPGDKIIIDERISRNLKGKLEHMDSLLRDKDLKQLALDEDDSIEFSSPFSEVDLEDSIDWLFS
jgi:SNF2 family DNA or RNA helicase